MGRDLPAAGQSLLACGAVVHHLCQSLLAVLVCASSVGPSPRFTAALIHQCLHLFALCLRLTSNEVLMNDCHGFGTSCAQAGSGQSPCQGSRQTWEPSFL